jgi:hypothetical protein
MHDYSRPDAQWEDLPSAASALEGWSIEYEDVDTTRYVSLSPEPRSALEPGLIITGEEETSGGTIATWSLVEQVNGEVEAQVVELDGTVYIESTGDG